MGRKKIQIQRITDERNKQVTFTKRKFGLMKKAYELSVLCDCEIALIIFNHANKLFQYASTDMDKVLLKYTEYNEPHESRTNADIIETLRKKGFNGCDSPEPDGEDSIDQSPLNDDKYRKTTEDLDVLFKRYGQSTAPPQTFSMPVTVQASNQSTLQFSNPGSALVTTSYVTSSSLTDTHLLSPQQPALQRNTVSPGLPQRPASAGALLGGDLNNSNGGCPSPVPNGYTSARASPGLLTVSNGNSLGKVVPAKSPPPPPSPQMVNSRKPDLRVITSQGGKSLMQMNAQRLAAGAQTLTTPVVSVATPSLLAQGLPFSAMPTAYNTEYQLTSADITALHALASPGGLLPTGVSTWQQQTVSQPSQQQQQQTQQQLNLASLSNLVMWGVDKQSSELSSQVSSLAANLSVGSPSNLLLGRDEWLGRPVTNIPQGAMLTVNTNSGVSIKSEPISPGRDRSTPCPPPSTTPSSTSGGTILTAPPQYPGSLLCLEPPTGRSPADSVSSNASSFEGSDRDDAGAAGGGTAGAGGGGGGAGGGGGSSAGPTSRSVPPDFSPSAELLRASNEQDQEGGNIKRMRLDAWVT
ncbi:myocyte-specific enhancer factor 2D homolog isoform X2 [Simochromis diagramma]|uniref:myocyte-specific enhancer factor 2D homolog isoform X2 n=1 Tax=Simochromis diagramma TaxID=43689 RepID=UPI001A7E5211|nr:myocyte-specific enhancer factor 2D homolog isoform X2 [Simochromis diagramma]